jgi:hypothetical protein
MDPHVMDATLGMLDPDELPGALCLLTTLEVAGGMTSDEADEWRLRFAAWYGFHSLGERAQVVD